MPASTPSSPPAPSPSHVPPPLPMGAEEEEGEMGYPGDMYDDNGDDLGGLGHGGGDLHHHHHHNNNNLDNDNYSALYDLHDDLHDLHHPHHMAFLKPDTLEQLLGRPVDFYNGTHVLCPLNTSLPPSLNGSSLRCIYSLPPLPKELYFTDDSVVSVIAYACLFLVAACGNLTVFITLFRNRGVKSRVNLFIMHLAIADLLVTFMMLPLEIAWHATVAWLAGDAMCRLMMFFRAFGFYLSSCILVTISLDRYFAIMHPLSISDATRRGKVMLIFSWAFSIISSIPQSVIFHVERHPTHRWFTQCVTFNFFPTPLHELAYNLFNVIALYGLPLVIITASYSLILCEISKKTRQSKTEMCRLDQEGRPRPGGLRRSAMGNIERARIRTLKMTLVIVGAFILCWTPYFVIAAWYWFDKASAIKIDPKIQRGLFLFAVSNSCINPIVYAASNRLRKPGSSQATPQAATPPPRAAILLQEIHHCHDGPAHHHHHLPYSAHHHHHHIS
ncbi:adipokinetic hormone/corazonin-related peptide receptor variant I-like isoform X2 [Babylonia areolata]|uniref:adipokinetic hormone/corazonin-related peptide receptor variant I-like isoform X2 n=1 Tax=Babylonia areolata TaxID=304850 RepID=UPI003FD3A709